MKKLIVNNPKMIQKQINHYLSSPQGRFAHRLHAILLLLKSPRYNCDVIARLLGESPRTISNWIHKINRTGNINVLHDRRKPGRKPKLSRKEEMILKSAVASPPVKNGMTEESWNGKILARYIHENFNIKLKERQCQRLLKKLDHAE